MADSQTALLVFRGGELLQTVPLTGATVTIGRAPENTVTLADQLVSRHHAEARLTPTGAIVTDLGSANGVFVGGERLLPHQPHPLAPGESFQIAGFSLTVRVEEVAPAEPLPDAGPDVVAPSVEPPVDSPVDLAIAAPVTVIELPRATSPALPAARKASRYLDDLPIIYAGSDFLGRFLLIFESIWEPLEQRQDHISMFFDPHTCPSSFLPWLASWLDLSYNAHWPEARRRRVLAEAMDLYRWRGTAYGLSRTIEVCTGLIATITESPDEPFVFLVSIRVPPGARVDRALIEDLILEHKPAHAGYRLEVKA